MSCARRIRPRARLSCRPRFQLFQPRPMSRQRTLQLVIAVSGDPRARDDDDVEACQQALAQPKALTHPALYSVSIDCTAGGLSRHGQAEACRPIAAPAEQHRKQAITGTLRFCKYPVVIAPVEKPSRSRESLTLWTVFQRDLRGPTHLLTASATRSRGPPGHPRALGVVLGTDWIEGDAGALRRSDGGALSHDARTKRPVRLWSAFERESRECVYGECCWAERFVS